MNIRSGTPLLLAIVSVLFTSTVAAESKDVLAELKYCARLSLPEARASCYEALGKRVLADESTTVVSQKTAASPGPVVEPSVAASVAISSSAAAESPSEPKMRDNMGGYQYMDKPSDHPDNDIHTRVTKCQQDMDKVWFFKFENGQVWKQVDRASLSFKDCDFPVIVSKDGFGYKMQVEGEGRKIRISRRK